MERKMLWATGIAAFICAISGLIAPSMYENLVLSKLYYAMAAQDIFALLAGLGLLVLGIRSASDGQRSRFWVLGMLAFLAYAYGIYSFEMVYTAMYLGYLIVLGLSVWTLVMLLLKWSSKPVEIRKLPKGIAIAGGLWNLLTALLFAALWISQLIPLIAQRGRLFNFFSIYVIDLAFVVPALIMSAVALLTQKKWSWLAGPSLSVLGMGILSPLVLGELVKSIQTGQALADTEFSLYLPIVLGFIVLVAAYNKSLSPRRTNDSQ
jgi:hypothetical protein